MNFHDVDNNEDDLFFKQKCVELAKLLRTEQTEDFLHLYDSLPSEWNGERLETGKEYIRQLQELDENQFKLVYQRYFTNQIQSDMSKQPSSMKHHETPSVLLNHGRFISPAHLRREQYQQRTLANDQAYDESHDVRTKHSSYAKTNPNELNSKSTSMATKQNQSQSKPNQVDIFTKLNLVPATEPTNLESQQCKKSMVDYSPVKNMSDLFHRHGKLQKNDINSNERIDHLEFNIQRRISINKNKAHHHAVLDYCPKSDHIDADDDDDDEEDEDEDEIDRSHSSSSSIESSAEGEPTNLNVNHDQESLSRKTTSSLSTQNKISFEHSKMIPNHGFDSHGSSTTTKSSSDNSASGRTGSGSDSDYDQQQSNSLVKPSSSTSLLHQSCSSTSRFHGHDDTPMMVLNKPSDYRPTTCNSRLSSLPEQETYQLVRSTGNDSTSVRASQVPRIKVPVNNDPNSTQDSNLEVPLKPIPSSSTATNHRNSSSERRGTHQSQSTGKVSSRSSKKRKQSKQQEIIITDSIPGHRGDLGVDELLKFIDGSATKSLRSNNRNKSKTQSSTSEINSNTSIVRKKSRKAAKCQAEPQDQNFNTKDEQSQSILIDGSDNVVDEQQQNNSDSITNESTEPLQNSTVIDESHSNTVDGNSTRETIAAKEDHCEKDTSESRDCVSPTNNDPEASCSSPVVPLQFNNESVSEPFVTVVNRRRTVKERRQENSAGSTPRHGRFSTSSTNDNRRYPSTLSSSTSRAALSTTIKPSTMLTATKEEFVPSNNVSTASSSTVTQHAEILSPRLSSHSSSSSISSLAKKLSKPPPVVFLNKSAEVELNGVSFGFDLEKTNSDVACRTSMQNEDKHESETNPTFSTSPTASIQSNEFSSISKSSLRSDQQQQQENNNVPDFYSTSDTHKGTQQTQFFFPPPSGPLNSSSSCADPMTLYQYNQQGLPTSYSQQLASMNMMRAQYLSQQTPYILVPAIYPATNHKANVDETTEDKLPTEERQSIREPLIIYTTLATSTGQFYYQPMATTKASYSDIEQTHAVLPPTMYSSSNVYPHSLFYSNYPNVLPTHPAYFQPIPSGSLAQSQFDESDPDEFDYEDHDPYDAKSSYYHRTDPQSSSHIMSNALRLVYSQEKKSTPQDQFNLELLTAHLAMRWTDTVNRYEQGDDEILFVN